MQWRLTQLAGKSWGSECPTSMACSSADGVSYSKKKSNKRASGKGSSASDTSISFLLGLFIYMHIVICASTQQANFDIGPQVNAQDRRNQNDDWHRPWSRCVHKPGELSNWPRLVDYCGHG
jgi:hypothetical protein